MSDAITEAQAPETFDVLSFVEHTAYPTKTVRVYGDAKSATDLVRLNQKRKDDEVNGIITNDYDEEIAALEEAVKKSVIVFNLRGLPPGIVRDIFNLKEDTTEEDARKAENNLIANTIIGVENAEGAKDSRVFDGDAVEKVRRFLKEGEFKKLVDGVVEVNFNAAVFDDATDAGFLGGSTNLES